MSKKTKKGESKAERFVRLAKWRVSKALKELRRIGNLSSLASYEYTEKQVKAITEALYAAVGNIGIRFEEPCSAEKEDFKFEDWVVEGDYEIDQQLDEDNEGIETVVHNDKTG